MIRTGSQNDRIINDLQAGVRLTQLEAYKRYGCTRLASRIFELKQHGFPIVKKFVTKNKKTYAQYYISHVQKAGTG